MSAFICNPEHIGLLAAYIANETLDAKRFARDLVKANIESVAHRYPDDKDGDRPGPALFDNEISEASQLWAEHYFQFKPTVTPVEILSLAACLNYQCCEINTWTSSQGYVWLNRARDKAIRDLPGYDKAAWEWTAAETPSHITAFYNSLAPKEDA